MAKKIEYMKVWFPEGVTELKAGTPIDEKGNVTTAENAHGFLKHDIHFPAGKAPVVVNGGVADWSQNDPTAPDYVRNRPFYEETVETDIAGMEISLGTAWSTSEVEHGMNLPLALGQVWKITNTSYANTELPVQEADDGTLYIGTYPNADDVPFYVTTNALKANSAWMSMTYPAAGNFVCVSGTVSETTIRPLDSKFLPENSGGGSAPDAVITTGGNSDPTASNLSYESGTFEALLEKVKNGEKPHIVLNCLYLYGTEVLGDIAEAIAVGIVAEDTIAMYFFVDEYLYRIRSIASGDFSVARTEKYSFTVV